MSYFSWCLASFQARAFVSDKPEGELALRVVLCPGDSGNCEKRVSNPMDAEIDEKYNITTIFAVIKQPKIEIAAQQLWRQIECREKHGGCST